MKIESRFIPTIFDLAKREYDVVLVDTHHVLDEINLTIIDYSYMTLFIIINDLVDFKNMKSLLSIFKDTDKFIDRLSELSSLEEDNDNAFIKDNILGVSL